MGSQEGSVRCGTAGQGQRGNTAVTCGHAVLQSHAVQVRGSGVQLNRKLEGKSLGTLICKLPQNTPGLSCLLDYVRAKNKGLWRVAGPRPGGWRPEIPSLCVLISGCPSRLWVVQILRPMSFLELAFHFLGLEAGARGEWDVHTDTCYLWSRSWLLHPLDSP